MDDYTRLSEALATASSLIIFCDNAGEIVFDRLLVETILERHPMQRLAAVVKKGPFINDAMAEDAEMVGLTDIPGLDLREVSNGDDDSAPAYASDEVTKWIQVLSADREVLVHRGRSGCVGGRHHRAVPLTAVRQRQLQDMPVASSSASVPRTATLSTLSPSWPKATTEPMTKTPSSKAYSVVVVASSSRHREPSRDAVPRHLLAFAASIRLAPVLRSRPADRLERY